MMYVGTARSQQELNGALTLAVATFRPQEPSESALELKRNLMSHHGTCAMHDVVVIAQQPGEVVGACFLIDRYLMRGANKVMGTFLTSICIADTERGNGLSRILMNEAIAVCERRGAAFAILIARRAVDHYYNKFFFWGLSQYSKACFNIPPSPIPDARSISGVEEPNLNEISRIYDLIYAGQYGAFFRTKQDWNSVLWKLNTLGYCFQCFKELDKVIGYVVFQGNNVMEIAVDHDYSYLEVLNQLYNNIDNKLVTVHCSSEHPLVKELHGLDFSVVQRECDFGGHMVRIINDRPLLQCLEEDISRRAEKLSLLEYSEVFGNLQIEVKRGKANIPLLGSCYDFTNTCLLMGVGYLSSGKNNCLLYRPDTFNVLFADQI